MVNLAVVEEMAEEEMRKRQLRQMLARQNALRSQRMPNIKEVITETDDDKPNKKVTTIDYSTILDEPPPVQEKENGGWLSYIKDPFKRFPATQLSTDFPERSLVGYKDAAIRDQMERDRLAEFEADERFSPVEGVQGPGDLNPEAPPFDIIDNQYVRRPDVERQAVRSGPSSMVGPLRDVGTWLSEVDWMGTTPFSSGKSQPEEEKEAIVEEVTGLLGPPETEETLSGVEGLGTDELGIDPYVNKEDVEDTLNNKPPPDPNDRIYAHYGEDIDGKEQRYLAALGDIYKKVAILNAVAALTNSPSQAGVFMEMASKKFETLEGFRTEKRLQKIGKGVFFTEDGTFNAPQTKQEAYERAIAFGASPDEAAAISGDIEEQSTAAPGKVFNWHNPLTGDTDVLPEGVFPAEGGGTTTDPLAIARNWQKGDAGKGDKITRVIAKVDEFLKQGSPEQARSSLITYYMMHAVDPLSGMLYNHENATKQANALIRERYTKLNIPSTFGESGDETPVMVNSKEEYDALAPGTLYEDSQGVKRKAS